MRCYNYSTEEIHAGFKKVRDTMIYSSQPYMGICHHLYLATGWNHFQCINIVCSLAEKWPKFSGCYAYPVPTPKDKFRITYQDIWAGDYGKLRWELLDWLIERTDPEFKLPPVSFFSKIMRLFTRRS